VLFCRIVIGSMAAVTFGGQRSSVIVYMACCARNCNMGTGKGETGSAVAEHSRYPSRCRMAGLAVTRELLGDVVGIGRCGVGTLVAAHTQARYPGKDIVLMAGRAGYGHMRSGERVSGRCMLV